MPTYMALGQYLLPGYAITICFKKQDELIANAVSPIANQ